MKKRVLLAHQEIMPYLPETHMSKIGRYLPQGIQEKGKEIRTFMPRYGLVNERRNQLHEVIRLSGMNLIIDDNDHPLIIKVASIQQARLQVYFIDNEEYFKRKFLLRDDEGTFFDDNDERAVFYARGVVETVKKLGWAPDIVHCHGWIASLLPIYIKKAFRENPLFENTKVVLSIYNDGFEEALPERFLDKVRMEGIQDEDMGSLTALSYEGIIDNALAYADGVVIGASDVPEAYVQKAQAANMPFMAYPGDEDYVDAFNDFYNQLLEE